MKRALSALAATVAFGAHGFNEEVPYVQTPDAVTLAMLELAGVNANDYVIDLGSGDGRIVVLAAKRFGARGLGVEIIPKLVEESRENAKRAGVADRAEFREQDLFNTNLAAATVITMYLLPEVNMQLRDPILRLKPGTRIVSHDWDMGSWKPDKSVKLDVPDKPIGIEKVSRVHLWVVPARVAGVWCAGARRLDITQQFQDVKVNGKAGRVAGAAITVPEAMTLEADGDKLTVRTAQGRHAALQLVTFARAGGQRPACPTR